MQELQAALKAVGRRATFYIYEGMTHWFFEPDGGTLTTRKPRSWPGNGRWRSSPSSCDCRSEVAITSGKGQQLA